MADLDVSLRVCKDCLNPVEGTDRCPNCDGLPLMCDPLAYMIYRFLYEKGWKVEHIKIRGHSNNKTVAITFKDISPGNKGVEPIQLQLTEDQKPVCVTNIPSNKVQAFRYAYEWAMRLPFLKDAIPFNRQVCEVCAGEQYDVEWLHGKCNCPTAGLLGSDKPGATGPHYFQDDFPRKCLYIAEQVMTKPERAIELLKISEVPKMLLPVTS